MAGITVVARAQLQSIVNEMRSAKKATAEFAEELGITEREAKAAQRQLSRMGKSAGKAGKSADSAKKGLDALKKGSEVAQGSIGALGSRLAGVVELAGMMGPKGIAVAAFVAGAAAMVIGAALIGKALLDNVLAADAVIKKYRELGREIPITLEQQQAISDSSAAWEEFGLILDDVGLIFSATIGPAVRRFLKNLLDCTLRVREVAASFKDWRLFTLDGIAALASALDPMRDFQGEAEKLIQTNNLLAEGSKANAAAIKKATEAHQAFVDSLKEMISLEESKKDKEIEAAKLRDEANKKAAALAEMRISNIVALKADAAAAEVEFAIQTAETISAIREQENADFLAAIDTEIAAVTARKVEIMEAEATIAAHRQALAEQEANREAAAADTRRQNAQLGMDLVVGLANLITQVAGESAIAQKVAAIFEATVRGAAQVAAVAANPVLAGLTAAIVGVQIASIAATPTPSFIGGGRVDGPMSPAGGVPALLHNGETVFNAVASRQFSDQDVARGNRGENIGGGGAVPFQFKHLLRWIELDRGDRVRSPGVLSRIDRPARFGHDTRRQGRHNGDL